jgi:WD40 repeat protein
LFCFVLFFVHARTPSPSLLSLQVWDLGKGYCSATLLCHSNVNALAPGALGGLLASGHFDGGLRFWDVRSAALAHELAGVHPGAQITSVAVSPRGAGGGGGGAEVLTNGRDNVLRVVDVRTFGVVATARAPSYRVGTNFARAAWAPDGRHAAAGGADGAVHVWALAPADGGAAAGGERACPLAALLRGHAAPVSAVAWAPDGAQLGSCDKNGVSLLWEA